MAEIYLPDRPLQDVDLRQPIADHPLNLGLQAWWKLLPQRFGGPVWYDLVKGNQATLNSFASGFGWNNAAHLGGVGSLKFNGTSNYLSTQTFGFNYGEMTFAVWVNATSLPTADNCIFDTSGSNVAGCPSFYADTANGTTYGLSALVPGSWILGQNTAPSSANATCSLNVWYYLCWVNDLASNTIRGYVNGIQTESFTYSAITFASSSQPKTVGRRSSGSAFFAGYMDGLALWNRPLTAKEVYARYLLGRAGDPGLFRRHRRVSYSAPSGTILNGSGSATLTGSASGSGNLALSAKGSATLTGSAIGQGSLSLRSQGAATLTGSASAPASPVFSARGSASLTGSASGTGQVQQPGTLLGNGSATLTGSATAKASLSLSAKGTAQAAGSATASASLGLAAKGSAALSGSVSARSSLTLAASGTASSSGNVSARPNVFLTALGAAILHGSATGSATLPSTILARGAAVLEGTATAKPFLVLLGKPEFIFVEPARSLVFAEPERNLTFLRQA